MAAIAFVGAILCDRQLFLGSGQRLSLSLGVVVLALAAFLVSLLLRVRGLRDDRDIARRIETCTETLQGRLLTATELDRCERDRASCSPELLARLSRELDAVSGELRLPALLPTRRILPSAGWLIGALLAVGLLASHDPSHFPTFAARFFSPLADIERPTREELSVEPGDTRLARGSDLRLQLRRVRGESERARIDWRVADESWRSNEVPLVDGRGEWTLSELTLPTSYRVTSGDWRSATFTATPRTPPRTLQFIVETTPPEGLGTHTRLERQAPGPIEFLRGSRVGLSVVASEALSTARLLIARATTREEDAQSENATEDATETLLAARTVHGERVDFPAFELVETTRLRIELVGLDGVRADSPSWPLRALRDRAPIIQVLEPLAAESLVEARSSLLVRARLEDDHGIRRAELLLGDADRPTPRVLFSEEDPDHRPPRKEVDALLSMAELGLSAGDTVGFKLRVEDGAGQASTSPRYGLRIAYPPGSPQGALWSERWRLLDSLLAELHSSWRPVPMDAGQLRHVRRLMTAIEESFRDTARLAAFPSPEASLLDSLSFWLGEFGRKDIARRTAALIADDQSADAEALATGTPRLDRIIAVVRLVSQTIAHDEADERVRWLAGDLRQLALDIDAADANTEDASAARLAAAPAARVRTLLTEVVRCAADFDSPRLAPHARALLISVAAELESALDERSTRDAALRAIQRATRAADRRQGRLRAETDEQLAQVDRSVRALRPTIALDTDLRALGQSIGRRQASATTDIVARALRVRARLDKLARGASSSESNDFESAVFLDSYRELVERTVDEELVARRNDAARGQPNEEGRAELIERLAAEWPPVGAAVEWGDVEVRLDTQAAALETLASPSRIVGDRGERSIGEVRRAERDVAREIRRLLEQVVTERPAGLDVPTKELLRRASDAADRAHSALASRPEDVPGFRRATLEAARELDAARARVALTRKQALAALEPLADWLRGARGTIVERLERLAVELGGRSRTTLDDARGGFAARDAHELLILGEREVAALRQRGDDIARALDRRAEGPSTTEASRELDRNAALALRRLLRGEVGAGESALRRAQSTDREDRVLLATDAAERLQRAANGIAEIARALELAEAGAFETLLSAASDQEVEAARRVTDTETANPEEIARRAESLLDTALNRQRRDHGGLARDQRAAAHPRTLALGGRPLPRGARGRAGPRRRTRSGVARGRPRRAHGSHRAGAATARRARGEPQPASIRGGDGRGIDGECGSGRSAGARTRRDPSRARTSPGARGPLARRRTPPRRAPR